MLSQYVVKAQNPEGQNAVTQVVALSELTFKEHNSNSKMVGSFKQSSTDETLMYSPEWDLKEKRFYMAGDEEFDKNSSFRKVQKKEQKVAHSVRSILQQWGNKQQGYELDSALHFNRLVEVVRQSTVKELHKIEQVVLSGAQQDGEQCWCKQCDKNCEEQAKSLFLDSLAVAATRNSLYVLGEKIVKQDIQTTKAVQTLQTFVANQHSPSEQQANILERIAKHEVAHRSPILKQTAWLSFASAVGSLCQDQPAQGQKENFRVEEICPRGKKEQYKNTLFEQFQKAENIYEQILMLKAIGNAALDNSIEDLRQIVNQQSQSTLVRMEAVDAMRRLRTSMPHKIRQVLLPIFQNQREQPEIRMAAFSMIMHTLPEKSIIDQMTFTVISDRSQNVKSFVLSTMEALAQSPSSAEQQVANHLKSALKMVRINGAQLRSSQKHRVPIYVSDKQNTEEQNIFLGLASIVSPSNMIPIHLSASLQSALNGEATAENLQISFTQKNLEQLYEKLSDYAQSYWSSNNQQNEDNDGQSAKSLRNVYSSLGIKSRRTGSYYLSTEESDEMVDEKNGKTTGNQPFGMIVIQSSNQLLSSGQQFQRHGAITINEKKTKIPTTSGFPLALMRQITAVGSAEGQLKVRFESESFNNKRGLMAALKLRTSAIATHLHKVEVWSPIIITGVQTLQTAEVNGPLEAKIRADSSMVELSIRPPQDHKIRFFALHTLPMTYTSRFEMDTRIQRKARVRTVHNRELEQAQREFHLGHQQQKTVQLEGHYHEIADAAQLLQVLYTTENNVHYYYVPSEQTPKELKVRVSGSMFQKHNEHSRPEIDFMSIKVYIQDGVITIELYLPDLVCRPVCGALRAAVIKWSESWPFFMKPFARWLAAFVESRCLTACRKFGNPSDESTQYSNQEQWQNSDEQEDQKKIQPVKRTQVIEYNHKVCFSFEPVKHCPRGSTPDDDAETKSVKAQFFCVERISTEGRQLQKVGLKKVYRLRQQISYRCAVN
ncbi:Vitellogenin-6 [Aphelenchoides besseyi]|nr:Vitellogenin-6 [Aphelenchoides besseyi]